MFSNKYVREMKPYPLTSHRAWEREGEEDVLKLDWNEATIAPSPAVISNIVDFLSSGKLNWYPDVNNAELLKELSYYCSIPEKYIQYFASSDSLHEYLAKCFIEAGDRVSIISPTYDNFRATVESCGAIVNYYYLDERFNFCFENLRDYLSHEKPKVVYICNPNNPTGTIYSPEDLEALVKEFENILFIVDEAYFEFAKVTCKDLVLSCGNLVICRTFSKAFALASFRVGYAIASTEIIETITKIRNPKNISTLSQIAAISALQDSDYMEEYVKQVLTAKEYFDQELSDLGLERFGNGGNFTLVKVQQDLKKKLIDYLQSQNIFVRDYSHVNGMGNYLRITIGTLDQMKLVLKCIAKFIKENA